MKIFLKGLFPCNGRKLNVNHYLDFFIANGHSIEETIDTADCVVLWTCGNRDDYTENCVEVSQKVITEHNKKLYVVGCLGDIAPERLNGIPSESIITWKEEDKLNKIFSNNTLLRDIPVRYADKKHFEDQAEFLSQYPHIDCTYADKFVKLFISEGCRMNCGYCSEKRAFPPYRSFPEDDLVSSCKKVIEETNQYDVMIIADSAGDYGWDIGSSFPRLIKKLMEIDNKVRIGICNFNPEHFMEHFDDFIECFKTGRMLQLYLPIQSASDKVLVGMNRHYTRKDLEKIMSALWAIDVTNYMTDIIIGFPGEDEYDFDQTIDFLVKTKPVYVCTNMFMESEAIPATFFPNKVPEAIKKQRLEKVCKALEKNGIPYNSPKVGYNKKRREKLGKLVRNQIWNNQFIPERRN